MTKTVWHAGFDVVRFGIHSGRNGHRRQDTMSLPNSSATIDAAEALLELARQRLQEPDNAEQGRVLLEALINTFPTTASATEAQRLLQSLPPVS